SDASSQCAMSVPPGEVERPDDRSHGAARPGMSIGFVAPEDPRDVRSLEEAGATSLWVGGHVAAPNGSPEVITWLSRLVEQTQHSVVGTAPLLLPLCPPGIVAKQLADLDRAADGRLVVGIGVGGEYESDFQAAGVAIR